MMKKLTRIRLINWHFFSDETIRVNGSFLVSGENTAGKSTVLDAIQLVLTTNTKKFNTAANEKGNRNLKGYVRGKIGAEDNTYLRKNGVISYVALEFFEEKTGNYFTVGTKIDSLDDENDVTVKWFMEECRFESLKFITNGRPSTTEEFLKDDIKVRLETRVTKAKDMFGRRFGNLEERFFEMIPKSLAFKPMDNVKDFINKFILPEKNIEVDTLKRNIESLKEFQDLIATTKHKIDYLETILSKNHEIELKAKEIEINKIVFKKAELENKREVINDVKNKLERDQQMLKAEDGASNDLKTTLDNERSRESSLRQTLNQNEFTVLITETKNNITLIEKDIATEEKSFNKLKNIVDEVTEVLNDLFTKFEIFIVSKKDLLSVCEADTDLEDKLKIIKKLKSDLTELDEAWSETYYSTKKQLEELVKDKASVEVEVKNLENKKLDYPQNTTKLKSAIEEEFLKQGIESDVRIFSELLEVTDVKWQNAVEGYLHTQRFNIIVDPKYYNIALQVYNTQRDKIHTVGLVNTRKLELDKTADISSLAYVVKSENRFARAYSIFLLGKVVRCEHVEELENFKVAITPECMLYQGYSVRKIHDKVYKVPYIGANAYEIQLASKKEELQKLINEISEVETIKNKAQRILTNLKKCKVEGLDENLSSPKNLFNHNLKLAKEKEELAKVENNPTYIEINLQIEAVSKLIRNLEEKLRESYERVGGLGKSIEKRETEINEHEMDYSTLLVEYNNLTLANSEYAILSNELFIDLNKENTYSKIMYVLNNGIKELENKKTKLNENLIKVQGDFNHKYNTDFGDGYTAIGEYKNEHHKLKSADIVKYEDDLAKAKENCELEFRESFLARLKENIENAKMEFKNLNSALKDIYYGEDSYKFEITHNKNKESIYQMITSKNNVQGHTLFSNILDEEYQEEIDELFNKLTMDNSKGDKVIKEYTDYRSYLDYDIIVTKLDGTRQRFSEIYGEKSGGETQTPYYVAIAASFVQLYSRGETIRIIMLDEAFDKMDDGRIEAMMDFFNSQNLQIILATPPPKMEVIGEKVDTILVAIREGNSSIIEEYDLW